MEGVGSTADLLKQTLEVFSLTLVALSNTNAHTRAHVYRYFVDIYIISNVVKSSKKKK